MELTYIPTINHCINYSGECYVPVTHQKVKLVDWWKTWLWWLMLQLMMKRSQLYLWYSFLFFLLILAFSFEYYYFFLNQRGAITHACVVYTLREMLLAWEWFMSLNFILRSFPLHGLSSLYKLFVALRRSWTLLIYTK